MPSSNSSKGVTTYEALPPAKQQQTFPNRRRSVKKKAPLPQLTKSQSTLTQLEFATPRSSKDVIEISGDEEYEGPQPKKKRKRKTKFDKREPGQSSMTQFERGDIPEFIKRPRLSGVDDDGFDVWEDYDPEKWEADIRERQRQRANTLPWLLDANEDAENEEYAPEIPETSHPRIESSPRVDSGVETKAQNRATNFQTPRKVRFKTEVPSSQTPPSTKFSTQASVREDIIQRSPLKERSNNAQAAIPDHLSPESQNISMKMLETVKFGARPIPLNDTFAATPSPEKIKSSQETIERHETPPKQPSRQLRRITTIQDSQVDVVEAFSVPDTHSVEQRFCKQERKTTIQNSQSEDLDLSLLTQANVNETFDDFEYHEDTQYHGLQSTYDPAYSALDRDAARFGWTQTQPPLDRIDEHAEDSETDDEDLDAGCRPRTTGRVVQPSDEPSQEFGEQSQLQYSGKPLETGKDESPHTQDVSKPALYDDNAYESEEVAHHDEVQVPSSPPPPGLRPSQVSTVVPTQASQQHAFSYQPNITYPAPKAEASQTFAIPSSPQKPFSLMPEILWSSPLPLPPWSSPQKAGFTDTGSSNEKGVPRGDASLESLVDFSLPPPPPLSSGRSKS